MLAYAFMRNALWAALLTGLLCSVVSFFIFVRRLPYATSGIAHAAFGGVALGLYLGSEPFLTAAVSAVGLAMLIGYLSGRGGVAHESTIGIVSAAAMAGGVVLLGLFGRYVPDLFAYLFGSILAIAPGDLRLLLWTTGGVLLLLAVLFRPLIYAALDPESAQAAGLPVAVLDYLLLSLVALTVVVAVRLLGIVLASALLIAPAATSYQLTRGYRAMLGLGVLAGVGAALGGLVASYQWDLAPGATITLATAGLFILACALRPWRERSHGIGEPRARQLPSDAAPEPGPASASDAGSAAATDSALY
jgi:ABC-type Mn2+/Zn2+ transport system permease subunit